MKIKAGVRIIGLKPEMIICMMIIEPIMEAYEQELVITSGTEGRHSAKSRHYLGYGLDIRCRDIPASQIPEAVIDMQESLGAEFFVLYEGNHIHIQFNGTMAE